MDEHGDPGICPCQASTCSLGSSTMKSHAAVFFCVLLCLAGAEAGLEEIEAQYRTEWERNVVAKHAAAVAELDGKYAGALDRAMQEASKAGRLEEAVALKKEIQRITDKLALPRTDVDVPPVVANFRKTYRDQLARLAVEREKAGNPIVQQFGMALVALQTELTQAGKLEEALVVKEYVASGIYNKLAGPAAAAGKPFENSLGMKFVPVAIVGGPSAGKRIQFCIWETRVRDYETFVNESKTEWPKPRFAQGPDHPAVMVSWEDATAFCAWLTAKERENRNIGMKDVYRLPTDHEWSCAVGIGKDEDASLPPRDKDMKLPGYPWGMEFPPPAGVFNGRVNDAYEGTSPVGSFPANSLGLFDLAGNAWEWCQESSEAARVLRGGGYSDRLEDGFRSSRRGYNGPTVRVDRHGFRVVLEVAAGG
jgi:hypothetical protein